MAYRITKMIGNAIGLLVLLLMIPMLLAIYIILWSVVSLIRLVAKIRFGSSVFSPSGFDMLAGSDAELSKPYFNVFFRAPDSPLTLEAIYEQFERALTVSPDQKPRPELRKWTHVLRQFCGYGMWIEYPDFDIKNHIREVTRDEFISDEVHLDSLEDYAGAMMKKFGTRDITPYPKWELLIFRDTGKSYVGLFRVHHSITDGLHFIKLLTQRVADKPVEVITYPRSTPQQMKKSLILGLKAFAMLPSGLIQILSLSDRNPLHGPKLTGNKIHLLSKPFPLDDVKKVKNILGVTVNDVIFSCAAKSVANHFENRGTRVDKVTSLLAVSRPMGSGGVEMKNNFLIAPVALPTGPYDESVAEKETEILEKLYGVEAIQLEPLGSLRRLARIKHNIDIVKKDPSLLAIGWLLVTASTLLPSFIFKHIVSAKGITFDITNLQGPQSDDWTFLGSSIEESAFFLADNDPMGLAFAILSFRGQFRVGLTVDRALMTEQQANIMVESLVEEVTTMKIEADALVQIRKKHEINCTTSFMKHFP